MIGMVFSRIAAHRTRIGHHFPLLGTLLAVGLALTLFVIATPAGVAYASAEDPGDAPPVPESEGWDDWMLGSLDLMGSEDIAYSCNWKNSWPSSWSSHYFQIYLTRNTTNKNPHTPPATIKHTSGSPTFVGFCADIDHTINSNQTMCGPTPAPDWWEVAFILRNYPPLSYGEDADYKVKQAARQAAVWRYSDGYILNCSTNPTNGNDAADQAVCDHYAVITDAVAAANPLFYSSYTEEDVEIAIDPVSDTNFLPGGADHPLVVTVKVNDQPLAGVTVTAKTDFGAFTSSGNGAAQAITDQDGKANFTVTSSVDGTANISATAAFTLYGASRFQHSSKPDSQQKLAFLNEAPVSKTAYATKEWTTLSLTGMKWNDLDSDGELDPGEEGLPGWTISLAQGSTTETTTTGSDGFFTFTGIQPGDYIVSEVQQPGWTQTYPAAPGTHEVTLTDANATGINFGNHRDSGSLSITKSVEWGSVTPIESQKFNICVKGPAPDETETCKDFAYDGGTLTWDDLATGEYTVFETFPGAEWDVSGEGDVTVNVDSEATTTITNTYKRGELAVTKIVNWNGATINPSQVFTICINPMEEPRPTPENGQLLGQCNTFSAGETYTWTNLTPGTYQVIEVDAQPIALDVWSIEGSGVEVDVPAGGSVSTTVTNTHKAPELDLTKEITPPGVNEATREITFTITVENVGTTPLESIPLSDSFVGSGDLVFVRSQPAATSPAPGTTTSAVLWDDILNGTNLNPGDSVEVTVSFQLPPTAFFTGTNTARVAGALDIYGTPANEDEDAVELKNVPTSVTLDYFKGAHNALGVILNWATLTEVNHFGFNLYRSSTGSLGDKVQINDDIIPGTGGPNTGAAYSFLDTDVISGQTYTYWLEDVDNDDQTEVRRSQPVTVNIPAAGPDDNLDTTVYLPLVVR
jgi:hypothetical protein